MEQLIVVLHVLFAVAIIALILLQHGKGADAGASFGSGASQTVFGGSGSGNALTRSTAILATLFFVSSFALAVTAKQKAGIEVGAFSTPVAVEKVLDEENTKNPQNNASTGFPDDEIPVE
ncbi:preprotein translocase subunit SecG [Sinobacterium caligoides]|uniref:Protein-export membrane protein SecG n=1 Tax=Sinobacterium caligoides TaxID=933926 RepID=A0A3N2DFR6_9GAMM|nr:preprotein translocase subunit SecG [Sinobacterium caligoides]ROR98645.1 preprotein translocase subunit SecG [Sinobacterium caligoides]